jgi:oxygen-independent coproporphyrinogen-3 oxidase
MTGLRTIWGVEFKKVEKEFGALRLELLKKNAESFVKKGLLEIQLGAFSSPILITSKKGRFLADGIASDLFIV